MYQALYRTYRPEQFSDVVGQEAITQTLQNEVATGKIAHAYLFCGPRGTGKTTCARILAKAVNCPQGTGGNPCGECAICKGIDEGSMIDITEIDAASNNSVDNVRELREEAVFTPVACRFRVYILDEVHMLSSSAFNALLKILEEPPEHVLFILATTEAHKVPATILSRCQRFDFKRISSQAIAQRLQYIAEKEGLSLSESGALLIARLSDGGMRDAISLLDVCAAARSEITEQTVARMAGVAGSDEVFALLQAIEQVDTALSLTILGKMLEESADAEQLCEELLRTLRNVLICKTVDAPQELVVCSSEELQAFQQCAQTISLTTLLNSMNVLGETLNRLNKAYSARMELEMAIVRLTIYQDSTPRPVVKNEPAPAVAPERAASPKKADSPPGESYTPPWEEAVEAPAPTKTPAEAKRVKEENMPLPLPDDPEGEKPFAQWSEVLEVLREKNPMLFGVLINAKAYLREDLLLIASQSSLNVLNNSFAKESLRDAVFSVTGKRYRFGPYRKDEAQKTSEKSPLQTLKEELLQMGADVEIQ